MLCEPASEEEVITRVPAAVMSGVEQRRSRCCYRPSTKTDRAWCIDTGAQSNSFPKRLTSERRTRVPSSANSNPHRQLRRELALTWIAIHTGRPRPDSSVGPQQTWPLCRALLC